MTPRTRVALAAVVLLFVLSALAFVRRPGIEVDEAEVNNPAVYSLYGIPLMDMSYVGSMKSWLYAGIFRVFKPGPASLRVPTIVLGAIALWLFFLLLDGTAGRRAAWIGTLLLATDTMFVVLEAIDFGPNALHFVFKLGAMVLLVRFHRDGRARWLAAGCFLAGLGLWDKTIFAWSIIGVSVAALAVFPRETWRHVTVRNVAIAGGFLVLGALPLLIYNVYQPLATFRSNANRTQDSLRQKAIVLRETVNGMILFGFFTAADVPPRPGEAATPGLMLSRAISEATHHPLSNLTIAAACAALLGIFARSARRAVLFGFLAALGAWIPMALTAGAGGAAHHVILLWPLHFLSIAAALAAVPWRGAAAAATLILCAANLALTNEYYWELVRNGPAIRWTDAIYSLTDQVERLRAPAIYVADWGIIESLNLLDENSPRAQQPDVSNKDGLRVMVSDPRAVFIAHTAHFSYMPYERAAIEDAASDAGYEEVPIETIYDRNGRPTFDVFRFRKIPL